MQLEPLQVNNILSLMHNIYIVKRWVLLWLHVIHHNFLTMRTNINQNPVYNVLNKWYKSPKPDNCWEKNSQAINTKQIRHKMGSC